MPYIQIDGNRTLTHTELVYGNSRVIDQTDPADHTACGTFESADITSACPYFSEIHSHTAAEFADLGKIIDTSVNPLQTVRYGIDEAAGELMIWLTCIGKCRCSHSHFQTTQHIIEFFYPEHPIVFFIHGQMQCDSEKHLLWRFQWNMVMCADDVAFQEQIESGKSKQIVAFRF